MTAIFKFKLPDVGEGVAEAEIVAWHVKVGDAVEEDQDLLDVMTDKATVEMPSPVNGRIVATHGGEGDIAPVGSVLVEIETEDAIDEADVTESASEPSPAPVVETQSLPVQSQSALIEEAREPPKERKASRGLGKLAFSTRSDPANPIAAPHTRARAYKLGIPLQFVPGSGPSGRITPQDLDDFIESGGHGALNAGPSQRAPRTGVNETKIIGIRRKIAERMQDAKSRIPHFSYIDEFDLTPLEALRKDLNDEREANQPKLTLLPFFVRAIVKIQPKFPHVNARFDDEKNILQSYDGVHIGIATQTKNGLMVPVVRHAETLSIWDCAAEIKRVTSAARDGSATRDELIGSTITLTSLGKLGGIAATPVINSPEVAIIGPNKLVERQVIIDGVAQIRTVMNVSSSFDHRIVDGYDAADFIQHLKRLIEQPAKLLMEEL